MRLHLSLAMSVLAWAGHATGADFCSRQGAAPEFDQKAAAAGACARGIAKHFEQSGEAPADIATATIVVCQDKLTAAIAAAYLCGPPAGLNATEFSTATLRNIAIETVVEIRADRHPPAKTSPRP